MGKRVSCGVVLLLLASASPARALPPWSVPVESKFSPAAAAHLKPQKIGEYRAWSEEVGRLDKLVADEIAACIAPGPVEPCVGMILAAWSSVDPALLERAMVATERQFPVPQIAIAGGAVPPATGAALALGLGRLRDIAMISRTNGSKEAGARRSFASAMAIWLAQGDALSVEEIADPRLAAQWANLEVVSQIDRDYDFAEQTDKLEAARKVLGDAVASNVAARQLKLGLYREAEANALSGHSRLRTDLGDDDPATIAAALILGRALAAQGKKVEARAILAPLVLRTKRIEQDAPFLRLGAIEALSEVTEGPERDGLYQQGITLASSVAQHWKPAAVLALASNDDRQLLDELGVTLGSAERIRTQTITRAGQVKARLLTADASGRMATDRTAARRLLEQAREADYSNRLSSQMLALLLLTESDSASLGQVESLLNASLTPELPKERLETILSNMLFAFFYLRWNAAEAPEYARRAVAGAIGRTRQQPTFDERALSELQQLRTVFATQVQANWNAQSR